MKPVVILMQWPLAIILTMLKSITLAGAVKCAEALGAQCIREQNACPISTSISR
jgi:hypothetical protein